MHRSSLIVFLACLACLASPLGAQSAVSDAALLAVGGGVTGTMSATAARAAVAPVIDGRDDDDVWHNATVIERFRVFSPRENGEPSFRTAARVAYDARNLYVFVRAFDPSPDSIRALLTRRDAESRSDEIIVAVDAYHDRRTAFHFAVNPVGVKRDVAVQDDGNDDNSWDAVWDAGARIDSLGWTAEFRIPLSQLRYAAAPSHVFGFALARVISRTNEQVAWPVLRPSRSAIVSQFGDLIGLVGLASPRRAEIAPYLVTSTANVPRGGVFRQQGNVTAGADVKYGLTSNLTIDGTVNPDFGQVEADPSQLNLSAFEIFQRERRPFFLEGQGLFRFDLTCDHGCQGLFYSRHIGRQPQLSGTYSADDTPSATTILGAAKLTGRLPSGFSVGLLDAVTQAEHGAGGATIEPRTNYFVSRAQQDFRQGASLLGAMVTSVNRSLDPFTDGFLRRSANTGGIDGRHRWRDNQWEANGNLAVSRVSGSASAIARTQRTSTRFFQRPDAGVTYDTTRTSLSGSTARLSVGKIGGGATRYSSIYQFTSPGFEANDLGFVPRADQHALIQTFGLQYQQGRHFRQAYYSSAAYLVTTAASRMRTAFGGSANAGVQLPNSWWIRGGGGVDQLGSYCDRCARGGPALRENPTRSVYMGFEGDSRMRLAPELNVRLQRGDEGRSSAWAVNPSVDIRLSTRFSGEIGVGYSSELNDAQWVANYGAIGADSTHYTFAHLEQRTLQLRTRLNFTATPTLSLQLYAQPFLTSGAFSNWREFADPRARRYDDRFRTYGSQTTLANNNDFNFKQLRSTSVVRWEYRPGSALFFVWTQERTDSELDAGSFDAPRDYRTLLGARPRNVFLVKGSYWLSL